MSMSRAPAPPGRLPRWSGGGALVAVLLALVGCTTSGAAGQSGPSSPAGAVPGPGGPTSAAGQPTAGPTVTRPDPPAAARTCPIFPATNVWHADVSHLPVLRGSATYVASIGTDSPVHADFGAGLYDGGPI